MRREVPQVPEEKADKGELVKEEPAEVEDKGEAAEAPGFISPNRVRRGNGNSRDCRWI